MTRRASFGVLAVVFMGFPGCATPVLPAGGPLVLRSTRGNRVPVRLVAGSQPLELPSGTEVQPTEPLQVLAPSAGSVEPWYGCTVVGGPQSGLRIAVRSQNVALRVDRTSDEGGLAQSVVGPAVFLGGASLMALVGFVALAIRQRRGLVGLVSRRDDPRWLAWVRSKNAAKGLPSSR